MRIAFDARAWDRGPDSFCRVLRLLVDSALEIGWQVDLWVSDKLKPEFEDSRTEVFAAADARSQSRAEVLWSPQVDVFPADIPIVTTIHDVNPLLPDGRPVLQRWLRGRKFRKGVNEALKVSAQVATDSEHSRGMISDEFTVSAEKISVVPLFADSRIGSISDADLGVKLGELGIKGGYILFVGSLRRHKNWDGLMRAYALLPQALRNQHELVLAGPAHRDMDNAESLADALGIRDQVRVLGEVREDHMSALYSGASLFAFPSFMEGFGLPPLEAMSCGVPVVATDRTSVPEVLGDAASYIDPGNVDSISKGMQKVLEDTALKDMLIEKGLRRAKEFGPERTGRAMEATMVRIRE
jgi:glycosyltransferase involved in cell wall biosynthesis